MDKKQNIVMAWGWSGGHVFPIKSLIECLVQKPEFHKNVKSVYRVWNVKSLEKEQYLSCDVQDKFLFKFVSILSWKLRRQYNVIAQLKNIIDWFLFIFWFFQSINFLINKKINVVFCKWGYIALPVVLAARVLRKKIIVHESDVHPGLVNSIASRFAKKTFTWFPNILPWGVFVGQILSDKILFQETSNHSPFHKKILKAVDHKNKSVVLVTWGSLWSKTIYEALIKLLSLDQKLQQNFIFLIVWGFLNKNITSQFSHLKNVFSFNFVSQEEMWILCHYSDLSITRAGTTSLAEQKLYNLKLLIIPIARTHDQHDNAKFYQKTYKDKLIDQQKNFPKNLHNELLNNIWYKKIIYNKESIEKKESIKHKESIEINIYKKISNTKQLIWKSILY